MMPQGSEQEQASALERGRELLEAQRRALVSGDLEHLDRLNKELSNWLARQAPLGAARAQVSPAQAASLRAALAVNASVATRAASSAALALDTLLAGTGGRTYGADGRSSIPGTRRAAFSA